MARFQHYYANRNCLMLWIHLRESAPESKTKGFLKVSTSYKFWPKVWCSFGGQTVLVQLQPRPTQRFYGSFLKKKPNKPVFHELDTFTTNSQKHFRLARNVSAEDNLLIYFVNVVF